MMAVLSLGSQIGELSRWLSFEHAEWLLQPVANKTNAVGINRNPSEPHMLRLAVPAGNTEYKLMAVSIGRTQTEIKSKQWIGRLDGYADGSMEIDRVDGWTDGWEAFSFLWPPSSPRWSPRCYLIDATAL